MWAAVGARPPAHRRSVLDGYRTTQHLLQSPTLGLDAMLTSEATADMWTRLMHACISVSIQRRRLLLALIVDLFGLLKMGPMISTGLLACVKAATTAEVGMIPDVCV